MWYQLTGIVPEKGPLNSFMCVYVDNMTDEKVGGASVRKRSWKDSDDLSLKCLQVVDRQDLDFTEQLWNILRGEMFRLCRLACLVKVSANLAASNGTA